MKVILLQDIQNLGKRYEVKDVTGGYARNFLFPKKLATLATKEALHNLRETETRLLRESAEQEKRLQEIARALSGRRIEFTLKTGEGDVVYGSVNKDAIAKALRETGLVGKERVEVALPHPLKELGEHKVSVSFRKGIEFEIIVRVLPQT